MFIMCFFLITYIIMVIVKYMESKMPSRKRLHCISPVHFFQLSILPQPNLFFFFFFFCNASYHFKPPRLKKIMQSCCSFRVSLCSDCVVVHAVPNLSCSVSSTQRVTGQGVYQDTVFSSARATVHSRNIVLLCGQFPRPALNFYTTLPSPAFTPPPVVSFHFPCPNVSQRRIVLMIIGVEKCKTLSVEHLVLSR